MLSAVFEETMDPPDGKLKRQESKDKEGYRSQRSALPSGNGLAGTE